MVTKILKQGKSARGSIDYNEDKVLRGEATPVMHCNMPDDTYDAIEDYILKPEENPAINGKTKNLGFHMTVCPGENDPIKGNEPLILGYIEEVMQRLGYDKQPYIVYRHNDIEREHYHIVGTRVKPDGHVVSKVNDRYVVRNAQRELAEKYGFVPGKGELTEDGQKLLGREPEPETGTDNIAKMEAGDSNKTKKFERIFRSALKFNPMSVEEFSCAMLSYGILVSEKESRKGSSMLVFRPVNSKGMVVSGMVSLDVHEPGKAAYGMVSETVKKNRGKLNELYKPTPDRAQLAAAAYYCIGIASSSREYLEILKSIGITPVLYRNNDSGDITRVVLASRRRKVLVDTAEISGLRLNWFTDAESSGKWKKPSRGRHPKIEKNTLSPDEWKGVVEAMDRSLVQYGFKKAETKVPVKAPTQVQKKPATAKPKVKPITPKFSR